MKKITTQEIDTYLRKMKVDGKTKIGISLLIELMDGFAEEMINKHSANPPVMGSCSLCKKELHYPVIAGYCSKECAEIALNKESNLP